MKITIFGDPISKMRARHTRRGNKIMTYDPQAVAKQVVKEKLVAALRDHLDSEDKQIAMEASSLFSSRAFKVEMWFYLPTNDSDTEAQNNAKLWGLTPANSKPDYDNLEKFYLDCASGVLWVDDRMIVDAIAHKRYGNPSRVEISVMPKTEVNLKPNAEGILKVFAPDDIKELVYDALRLESFVIRGIDEIEESSREPWLTATAALLSTFSEKWSAKLKKIAKFADVALEC